MHDRIHASKRFVKDRDETLIVSVRLWRGVSCSLCDPGRERASECVGWRRRWTQTHVGGNQTHGARKREERERKGERGRTRRQGLEGEREEVGKAGERAKEGGRKRESRRNKGKKASCGLVELLARHVASCERHRTEIEDFFFLCWDSEAKENGER